MVEKMSISDIDIALELKEEYQRILQGPLRLMERTEQEIFRLRFEQHLPDVLRPLKMLYGDRPDFDIWLAKFLDIVARSYAQRPAELRLLSLHPRPSPPLTCGANSAP